MSDELTIRTNHQPRPILDASELTDKERKEFDYLDWPALDRGEASASFFRYKGTVCDLGEFMTTSGMPEFSPLIQWDGYCSNSFFSGIVVRYTIDYEFVVVGTYFA
jgi:hypothetical protein